MIHTLKGTSMLFGLESVARLCHDLESRIAETGHEPSADDLTKLSERWKSLTADVDRLIGERREVIELSPEDHLALEQAVQRATSREDLLRMIRDLKLETIDRRFRHIAEQAHRIAARQGKQIQVNASHGGIRLDAKSWAPFWAAFGHALRNAIGHGIESVDERSAAGKSASGRIALSARREGTSIIIGIEDDGRGIDWEAIRSRCIAQGLASSTQDDLVAALFADGVSTTLVVTDLSGRGMGMSALLAAVHALDGNIAVRSERGVGTRLSVSFPASAQGSGSTIRPLLGSQDDVTRSELPKVTV